MTTNEQASCQVLLTMGAQSTGRILTRRTRCQSTRTAGLKDERRGSIQISGWGNGGEYLASAPVKRGLTRGTRSRWAGAPVSSAGVMTSAGEGAREGDGRWKRGQASVRGTPEKRGLDKGRGGGLAEQRGT